MLFAIIFAFIGAGILRNAALDPLKREVNDLGGSEFWLVLSIFTALCGVLIQSRQWWQNRFNTSQDSEEISVTPNLENSHKPARSIIEWLERHAIRFFLLPIAILAAWFAYSLNIATNAEGEITGIVFTRSGFL